jgi:hypothetical protein
MFKVCCDGSRTSLRKRRKMGRKRRRRRRRREQVSFGVGRSNSFTSIDCSAI